MIPLQMELGGKDACIVLDDADLDLAAANIVKGGFSYRFSFTQTRPTHILLSLKYSERESLIFFWMIPVYLVG